jgi:alpha-beta hydrolase superfamily lysophospholipase
VATIVLVHGLWLTPRCWEHWIVRYEQQGHHVLAPAYPGLDVEVEALREDPSPIAALTPQATLAHLEGVVRELERPIVIGHSFGAVLARSLRHDCAATVALHALPGLDAGTPGTVTLTPEQFRYALANTMAPEESARLYARYVVPAPGTWAWHARGGATLEVGGSEDNLVEPVRGAYVIGGRCHLSILQDGWEQVADDVLMWALEQ